MAISQKSLLTGLFLILLAGPAVFASQEPVLISLEGRVTLSGNEPFTAPTVTLGSEQLVITGALAGELRKVQNTPLRLVGWRKGTSGGVFGAALEVLAYSPVADGYGKPPRALIGILMRQDPQWLLLDLSAARLVPLSGLNPEVFRAADGSKVFLTGRLDKGLFSKQTFVVDGLKVLAGPDQYSWVRN